MFYENWICIFSKTSINFYNLKKFLGHPNIVIVVVELIILHGKLLIISNLLIKPENSPYHKQKMVNYVAKNRTTERMEKRLICQYDYDILEFLNNEKYFECLS